MWFCVEYKTIQFKVVKSVDVKLHKAQSPNSSSLYISGQTSVALSHTTLILYTSGLASCGQRDLFDIACGHRLEAESLKLSSLCVIVFLFAFSIHLLVLDTFTTDRHQNLFYLNKGPSSKISPSDF